VPNHGSDGPGGLGANARQLTGRAGLVPTHSSDRGGRAWCQHTAVTVAGGLVANPRQ